MTHAAANRPFARDGVGVGPVLVDGQVSEAEWDAFVEHHPDATGYHRWAWRTVFEDVFGHHCHYLGARQGGVIAGVLPLVSFRSWLFGRFLISLPFVNYGGVLASSPEVARALLQAAGALAAAERASHVELRHRMQQFPDLPSRQHKVSMLLPLASNAETMWETLDRKVRNQVRKAEKSGLVAEVGGFELVPAFYDVFKVNMRDLGTPVYSRRLFERVLSVLPDATNIVVVRLNGQPIAAGLTHTFRGTMEVPWASSLREHNALSPNNLLYWTIVKHAIATGQGVLDFGRSTPNEGTYHFKKQWGAEPLPLCWEYALQGHDHLPDQSPKNPKFAAAIAVWKRLPVGVATALGPHIVSAIP